MDIGVFAHSHEHSDLRIECLTAANQFRPEGYPVLNFGDLTIFPTREQLEKLRDAIGGWLAQQPASASVTITEADAGIVATWDARPPYRVADPSIPVEI